MSHPDGRVRGVDRLTAGATGAEYIDLDVIVRDLDAVRRLDQRNDLDGSERGLSATLVVKGRDAHETMGARLDRESAVRVGNLDLEGGRLQTSLLGIRRVEHRDRVAVPLRPPQIHSHQHLGEVGCVHAASARPDRYHGLTLVPLTVEQSLDLKLTNGLLQAGQLLLGVRHCVGVGLLGAELDHQLEVVDAIVQPSDPLKFGVGARQTAGDLLGCLRVVPQVRGPGLLLKLGDLGAQRVQIGHLPHRLHGRAKVLEL